MINQEWTILRNWQHWVHMTQGEDKQNKNHNTENYKDEQHGPHQVCRTFTVIRSTVKLLNILRLSW